jgi:uncharacterized RDD family membrane protein YckC
MLEGRPVGFWRRAVALAIDGVLVGTILGIGQIVAFPFRRHDLVAQAFLRAWVLVWPVAYLVLAHGTSGQTLGKWVMDERVVSVDGATIGYGRALGRAAAWVLAAIVGIGLLSVAWRRDKRGWHDRLAGTRVVRLS